MVDVEVFPECDRVGYKYTTRGRTVSEADIIFHGGQTGDNFSGHMDAEAARVGKFGQRIAHGTLTLSIAMGLKFTTDGVSGKNRISYGYDRVRYRRPVFIGDTIHVDVEVTSSTMDPKREGVRRVIESMQVLNQRGEVVLSVDHILVRFLKESDD